MGLGLGLSLGLGLGFGLGFSLGFGFGLVAPSPAERLARAARRQTAPKLSPKFTCAGCVIERAVSVLRAAIKIVSTCNYHISHNTQLDWPTGRTRAKRVELIAAHRSSASRLHNSAAEQDVGEWKLIPLGTGSAPRGDSLELAPMRRRARCLRSQALN